MLGTGDAKGQTLASQAFLHGLGDVRGQAVGQCAADAFRHEVLNGSRACAEHPRRRLAAARTNSGASLVHGAKNAARSIKMMVQAIHFECTACGLGW